VPGAALICVIPEHPLPPPPHAVIVPEKVTSSISTPRMVSQLRRFVGMPISRMHAKAAPPAAYQGVLDFAGWTRALVVAAVVETVRVAVTAGAPVILTGLVEPKPKVGGAYPLVRGLSIWLLR